MLRQGRLNASAAGQGGRPAGKLLRKLTDASFLRFLCVGVVNTLIGVSLNFVLFNYAFWGFGKSAAYWCATFLSNAAGATVSFFLNRSFTFRSRAEISRTAPRFVLVILLCYLVAYKFAEQFLQWGLAAAHWRLGDRLEGNAAYLFGMCVYTLLNYFGQKLFVFRKKPDGEGRTE